MGHPPRFTPRCVGISSNAAADNTERHHSVHPTCVGTMLWSSGFNAAGTVRFTPTCVGTTFFIGWKAGYPPDGSPPRA